MSAEQNARLPAFLVSHQTIEAAGHGPTFDLSDSELNSTRPATLLVTLGITHVIEQQSLHLAIKGSADGQVWDAPPLAAFPQKFVAGVSSLLIAFESYEAMRYVRAEWKLNRWGRGSKTPNFHIYVYLEAGPALQKPSLPEAATAIGG